MKKVSIIKRERYKMWTLEMTLNSFQENVALQTPFPKIASDKDQFLQGLMGVATARNKTEISLEKKCEPSYGFGPQTISWKFNRAK